LVIKAIISFYLYYGHHSPLAWMFDDASADLQSVLS